MQVPVINRSLVTFNLMGPQTLLHRSRQVKEMPDELQQSVGQELRS